MDNWLSKPPTHPLPDIDGILLDQSEMGPVFRALKARLFPDTVVIINVNDSKQAQGLPEPCRILDSYYIYDTPLSNPYCLVMMLSSRSVFLWRSFSHEFSSN